MNPPTQAGERTRIKIRARVEKVCFHQVIFLLYIGTVPIYETVKFDQVPIVYTGTVPVYIMNFDQVQA
jgi:hypothetical protein